eukprot:1831956-Rhodomonas_salina.2
MLAYEPDVSLVPRISAPASGGERGGIVGGRGSEQGPLKRPELHSSAIRTLVPRLKCPKKQAMTVRVYSSKILSQSFSSMHDQYNHISSL